MDETSETKMDEKKFAVSEEILRDVQKFLDENLEETSDEKKDSNPRGRFSGFSMRRIFQASSGRCSGASNVPNRMVRSTTVEQAKEEFECADFSEVLCEKLAVSDIDTFISSAEETPNFQNTLQKLIADRNLENAAVYKKAFIDKKFFSKIISNRNYVPKKQTVMALGLALELPLDEYERFLASAGYAFMPSSKFDLIVKYCVMHGIFALFEIDAILDTHHLDCFVRS